MGNQKQRKETKTLYRRVRNAVLGAALATGIGIAAAACGGRSGLCPPDSPYCFPQQDGGADVWKPDAQAPKQDAQPKQDSGTDAQKTDGGVPPVVPIYTIKNLIGDYLNRDLLDRDKSQKSYSFGTPETDPNANPFSDGAGGNLGPTDVNLHRVDGNMAPQAFGTLTLQDTEVGKVYQEQQDLWVRGDSHYSDMAKTVIGKVNSIAYTLKFRGAADDFGIPVCTVPNNGTEYASCTADSDYQTAAHKLRLRFLGDDWVVTEMTPPSGVSLPTETQLVNGGQIKIAKEAVTGIVNQGQSLVVDNLKFRYDTYQAQGGNVSAVITILDANGVIKTKDVVPPGATKEYQINGKKYLFHLYKVAPGATPTTNWIDCAIFERELTLRSGQALDADNGTNKYNTVYLGWRNKGASALDTQSDHLRTIIIYSDQISKLSSNGSAELNAGDYIPIVQDPVAYTLNYNGLSALPSDYSSLRFELERNSDYPISATYGPVSNGQRVSCTVKAPYVHVVSGAAGSVFKVDGVQGASGASSASGNEFYVATNGATCGGTIGTLMKGSLFMKQSPASDYWTYLDYAPFYDTGSVVVKYPAIGDGVSDNYRGFVGYAYHKDYVVDSGDFGFSMGEAAGTGVSKDSIDAMYFSLRLDGAASTFNFDGMQGGSGTYYWCKKDTIAYWAAGPVDTLGLSLPSMGGSFRPEGYVTERGSTFTQISDTLVEFKMAGQLVYSQFVLVKK